MVKHILFVERDGKEYKITLDTRKDHEVYDNTDQNGEGRCWYIHETKSGELHYFACDFSQWANYTDDIIILTKEEFVSQVLDHFDPAHSKDEEDREIWKKVEATPPAEL